MEPLIVGRILSFTLFVTSTIWSIVWMVKNRDRWQERFPYFTMSLNGSLFYGIYLLFYLHPALTFNLQLASDWGSMFVLHIAIVSLFLQVEEDTGFFGRATNNLFQSITGN